MCRTSAAALWKPVALTWWGIIKISCLNLCIINSISVLTLEKHQWLLVWIFFLNILPFYISAILSFILVILESSSKHVPPSSPLLHSHLSNTSHSVIHKISESHSYSMQSNATSTQLKPAHGLTPIKHHARLQSRRAKKQTDTPKKSDTLSKEHKTEESSTDLVSFEDIMALFKPMLPCISPLPDLVRIQCKCFLKLLLNVQLPPFCIYDVKMLCCLLFI